MLIDDNQEMVRDMARRFAAEKLAPKAADWDRTGEFPRAEIAEMGALGLMGMRVPEEWVGAMSDHVAYALALEEIAGGDGAVSTIMSVHNSVGCVPILRYGTDDQKETFLRPMARGEKLGAFCLTAPHAGSDAAALKTKAVRTNAGWKLNGTKQFITSGQNADVAIVFAVTDPEAGKKGSSAFIVPTDTPGYRVASIEKKLGQHLSDTAQIALEDLEVPAENLLGEDGMGYRIALSNLEGGRSGIAAQSVGMARAALDHAVAYAQERQSMGTSLMGHQAVAFRLADMATRVEAAHQMVLHAAALRDAGRPALKEASMAKLFASRVAVEAADRAVQIHGGVGYFAPTLVERLYRDAKVTEIYEGTSEVQRMIISRNIFDT